jgi:hypothetical protein
MAVFAHTKQEIVDRIETLLRNLLGRESPTYQERKTIDDAINAAIVDLCLDSGISNWRFLLTDDTEVTTADTAYVDLDENIYNVVSGTVRIEAENATLEPMSLEYNYTTDPDQNDTGQPQFYALESSGDAETMRMVLKPIPNAAYTIAFVGESIPDEDSISTLPAWMHSCLKDKAILNALRDLGLSDRFPGTIANFTASYEKRKQDNKSSQGHDIPIHINRPYRVPRFSRGIQSRLPD